MKSDDEDSNMKTKTWVTLKEFFHVMILCDKRNMKDY